MTNTLLDLSGKIDKVTVSALGCIHQILSSIGIPFFVVGATARDILLDFTHGIGSKRATVDIDIAVFIGNRVTESQWTYCRVTGLQRNRTKKLLLFSTLC